VIDLPELPTFDVPDYLKNKKFPADVRHDWMAENLRHLKESGQMERIRAQKSRQPVNARFTL
jgi:hypothetical protein